MKKTINFYEFSSWFEEHRPNNFSKVGLQSLFDYLEELEEDTGYDIEFDPIALCCEYTQYENINEFHQNYISKKEYQESEDEYYESLKYLKQIYFENNN